MNTAPAAMMPDFRLEAGRTLLFLVRHAQTTWNVERRFQGQLDVPLSDIGHEQAIAIADWLCSLDVPFSAVYTSDLRRAADTALPIATGYGLVPIFAKELRELNAGDWRGLTTFEVEERYPGQLVEWHEHVATFTLPGGESVADVQRRVVKYVLDVIERHRGEAIAAVSHGAALSSLVAALNGWDLQETWDSRRARMSNTGVTVLSIGDEGMSNTLLFNSTAHLSYSADLLSVIDPEPTVDKHVSAAEFAV